MVELLISQKLSLEGCGAGQADRGSYTAQSELSHLSEMYNGIWSYLASVLCLWGLADSSLSSGGLTDGCYWQCFFVCS